MSESDLRQVLTWVPCQLWRGQSRGHNQYGTRLALISQHSAVGTAANRCESRPRATGLQTSDETLVECFGCGTDTIAFAWREVGTDPRVELALTVECSHLCSYTIVHGSGCAGRLARADTWSQRKRNGCVPGHRVGDTSHCAGIWFIHNGQGPGVCAGRICGDDPRTTREISNPIAIHSSHVAGGATKQHRHESPHVWWRGRRTTGRRQQHAPACNLARGVWPLWCFGERNDRHTVGLSAHLRQKV